MKHLKKYENYNTGNSLDYNVGDIVVLNKKKVNVPTILDDNDKYEVIRIYSIPEDVFLKNPYMRIDIRNIRTDEIIKGYTSDLFRLEIENDADIYNI